MKNMGEIMKQAQKMQAKIVQLQEELATRIVEASAGGGRVTVTANGKQEIVKIKIDPEVLKANDLEMLEDLILAATNEALRKAQEMIAQEMSKITGGLRIPGLF